jgi:Spy/CpxP family protein refolding chaperone
MTMRFLPLALALASLTPALARADPAFAPGVPGPPGLMRVVMGPPPFGGPPFGDDPAMMLPALLQGVGLSDDQKKQVRELLKANHQTLFTNFEQLRTANQALADKLVSADPVTEQDLQPLVDQVMRARQDIMTQGLKVVLQVRTLLTPEQLTRAAAVKAKMNDLRKQMHDLLGEPMQIPLGDVD